MKTIYFDLHSRIAYETGPLVAAIGFFDGLHQGHKQLVENTVEQAKKNNMKSALITFSPSPESVLANRPEKLLTTIEERIVLAKNLGIEVMIILRFSKELSQLEPMEFYENVIEALNIKHLVCGADFRFGYRGSGNVETLKNIKGLDLTVIPDINFKTERISSTRIKEGLNKGEIESINEMLGYEYELFGYVKHGRKKGRTIGFPTLNLLIEESKIVPRDGVYVGISTIKGVNYMSTINIGHNPTINTVEHKSVESYVHNYNQDTYGQSVSFKILKYIRCEKKFSSVNDLIEQMHRDIETTETYFDNEKRRFFKIETI